MWLSLFGLMGRRQTPAPKANRRTTPPAYFRPALETLEGRVVPSAAPALAPNLGAALVAPAAHGHGHAQAAQLFSITGVTVQNGKLVATAALGNQTTQVPLDLTLPTANTAPAALAAATTTPILNLHVGPINLDLLGLEVATSQICLSITAQSGPGNLLGNLLTTIANGLSGSSLGTILGNLTPGQLTRLTNGLTNLLNGVLRDVLTHGTASTQAASEPEPPGHQDTPNTCEILNLSLGPVNLNLLGLNVHLDDCAKGPVIVDIDAIPSTDTGGGLLGDLLCGVANLLNNPGALQGQLGLIVRDVNQLTHDIEGLV